MHTNRFFQFVSLLVIATLALTACGPSQADYNAQQTQIALLQAQVGPTMSVEQQVAATVAAMSTPTQQISLTPQSTSISPVAQPTQATAEFPLKGLRFPAYAGGKLNTAYDLFVEANGRFWQPDLPAKPERVAHSVAFELPQGKFEFNGSECKLHLDTARNSEGSANPMTVGEGNGLVFEVRLPQGVEYATAYALVECAGNSSTGFDIWFLGK